MGVYKTGLQKPIFDPAQPPSANHNKWEREINGKWLLIKRCCGAAGMKGSEQISTLKPPPPPFPEPTVPQGCPTAASAALARPPFPIPPPELAQAGGAVPPALPMDMAVRGSGAKHCQRGLEHLSHCPSSKEPSSCELQPPPHGSESLSREDWLRIIQLGFPWLSQPQCQGTVPRASA